LDGRKGIRPVKTDWWSAAMVDWWSAAMVDWWSAAMVICLERSTDMHMAQLMLLPFTVCLLLQ